MEYYLQSIIKDKKVKKKIMRGLSRKTKSKAVKKCKKYLAQKGACKYVVRRLLAKKNKKIKIVTIRRYLFIVVIFCCKYTTISSYSTLFFIKNPLLFVNISFLLVIRYSCFFLIIFLPADNSSHGACGRSRNRNGDG